MKYLGIRTSLVTMHAPWVVHTTAVGQTETTELWRHNRHRTLRSHAWRITGGSRHALTTSQYLDKTDSADRCRYSCDIIKTLRATEATCSATSKAIAAAIIRGHTRDGRLHATRHSWHLKPTETLLMYFLLCLWCHFCILDLWLCESSNSPTISFHMLFADNDGWHLTAVDLLSTDNHKDGRK